MFQTERNNNNSTATTTTTTTTTTKEYSIEIYRLTYCQDLKELKKLTFFVSSKKEEKYSDGEGGVLNLVLSEIKKVENVSK